MAACARVWTVIAAGLAGVNLSDEIDSGWRERTTRELGSPAPATLRDQPLESGEEKVSPAAREVVAEVKARIFPYHGLEPSRGSKRTP